ncbi:MAG: Heme-binding protein A [Dehalococcoidia bacterium]|nr:Heme-binding protein A [Bacillota bacterium]
MPQVLTVLLTTTPDIIDPAKTNLIPSYTVFSLIVSTLVAFDHDLKIVPYLAESWEASGDELTWTFQIRRGVRFHDGTPVNAEAVAWSLNRFRTEGLLRGFLAPIREVVAVGEYVVEIRLHEVFPLLLQELAIEYVGIVSPAAVEKYGVEHGIKNMVGSGPFKFYEFIHGDRAVVVRNEEYVWGPAFVKNRGPAHLERIIFRVVPEAATRIMELERGRAVYTGAIPTGDILRLKADPNIQAMETLWRGSASLTINVTKWPLSDVRIRRALNHAVDRDIIIEHVLDGFAVRAYSNFSPAQVGFYAGVKKIAYEFDPQKARELFAEAGWSPGPDGILIHRETGTRAEFELWVATIEERIRASEVIKAQLREIGVDLRLTVKEGGAIVAGWRRVPPVHDMLFRQYGWPIVDGALHTIYHSGNIGAGNASHLAYEPMDELVGIVKAHPDPAVRARALKEAQMLSVKLATEIPLWHPISFAMATADVGGVELLAAHPWWSRRVFALDLYVR